MPLKSKLYVNRAIINVDRHLYFVIACRNINNAVVDIKIIVNWGWRIKSYVNQTVVNIDVGV